jgi:hypothetical protein
LQADGSGSALISDITVLQTVAQGSLASDLQSAAGDPGKIASILSPTVSSISATTDDNGTHETTGHLVTITTTISRAAAVTGIPTLQLNDNEVAVYAGGSGSNVLTFKYTVQSGDNVADLMVTGLNLPSGATIQDQAGNNLAGSVTADLGLQIDTTPPAVSTIATSSIGITNGNGDLDAGKTVGLTVTMSEAVTVAGGTLTLALNDGGTATFDAAHSTSTSLFFTYTIAQGESTSDLIVSSLNPNGSTIQDAAGNNADLSGASNFNPAGILQIDTHIPPAFLPPLQVWTTPEQQAEAVYTAFFARAGE